jgi:ABC-type lipoprotein release transport system permease subunit
MIFKIAWLNIWRSPLRSFVVLGSVMIGVWALISLLSFSFGMIKSYVNNAIRIQTSHIQIHHPEFKEDQEVKYFMKNPADRLATIRQIEYVQAATARIVINGMLATSRGARGVAIRGVDPESEKTVTKFTEKITEGEYFAADKKNQILISKRLAKKLKIKLRKKVVLQFQDLKGDIVAGAFRIVGLFNTENTPFDEANVFVLRSDINRLLGNGDVAHEIAIFLNDPEDLAPAQAALKAAFPNELVENYREISPDINLYESQIGVSATIFIFIFMLALIFGIINTMLMAVLERTRELGMLMSIGMNKLKVFGMVVFETIILGFIGAPIGLGLGWLTVQYFTDKGLDLSAFSGGMEQFGMSTIVYPALDTDIYIQLGLSVVVTAVLASIYPAFKAISLRPVEAIRKI